MIRQERKCMATSEGFLRHLGFVKNKVRNQKAMKKLFPALKAHLLY